LKNKKEEDKTIIKHKKNTESVDLKKLKNQEKNLFKSKPEEIINPLRNRSYNKIKENPKNKILNDKSYDTNQNQRNNKLNKNEDTNNDKKIKKKEEKKIEEKNSLIKLPENKIVINSRRSKEIINEGPLKNILRNSDGKRIIRNLDDKNYKVVRFSINENNNDLINNPSIIVLSKKNQQNNNINNSRYNDEDNSVEETKDNSKDVLFIKKINNIKNKEKNSLNFSYDQNNHAKKMIDQKRILKLNPLSKSMNLNKYGDDFDKFVENFDETEISDAKLILSSDLDDIYKNIYDDSLEFKNDVFFKGLRHLDDRIGLFDKK
jgi:hypothetical protein